MIHALKVDWNYCQINQQKMIVFIKLRQKEECDSLNKVCKSCWNFSLFGESVSEGFDIDVLDQWVPFVGSFFFGSLSWDSDSDSSGQVSDTLVPNELIELGVDSYIRGFHHFGHQASNFRKGLGSFLFELSLMCELMNVDGGVDSALRETFSLLFFSHFNHEIINIKNINFLFLCV